MVFFHIGPTSPTHFSTFKRRHIDKLNYGPGEGNRVFRLNRQPGFCIFNWVVPRPRSYNDWPARCKVIKELIHTNAKTIEVRQISDANHKCICLSG